MVVAGLGNPGPRYADSRHNIGFLVADRVLSVAGGVGYRDKFQGAFALLELQGERVGLLKPMTYMNESGRSVRAVLAFYKLGVEQLLVIHDELDLPLGQVRLKSAGGEAGHNGLRSISRQLGSSAYGRLRVGIGRPPPDFGGSGADYVLQAFPAADRKVLGDVCDRAAEAVQEVARQGLPAAMNTINRRKS